MGWRKLVTSHWFALLGVVEMFIGFAERLLPEGSKMSTFISPPIAHGLIGMGSSFLFLYVLGKAIDWKGEDRTWGDVFKPGLKIIREWQTQLILLIFVAGIALFIYWDADKSEPVWIWMHPGSHADPQWEENNCRIKSYDKIEMKGPLMVGYVEHQRDKYVDLCMKDRGFAKHRVDQ